jgi:hypothetical protein
MIGGKDDDQIPVQQVDPQEMSAHLRMLPIQEGPLHRVLHRDGAEGEESQT